MLVSHERPMVCACFGEEKKGCPGGFRGGFGPKTGFLGIFPLSLVSKTFFSKIFGSFLFVPSNKQHIWAHFGQEKKQGPGGRGKVKTGPET